MCDYTHTHIQFKKRIPSHKPHHDRYQKFSREVSQTAWVVDGGQRMGKASVEEIVAEPVKEVDGLFVRWLVSTTSHHSSSLSLSAGSHGFSPHLILIQYSNQTTSNSGAARRWRCSWARDGRTWTCGCSAPAGPSSSRYVRFRVGRVSRRFFVNVCLPFFFSATGQLAPPTIHLKPNPPPPLLATHVQVNDPKRVPRAGEEVAALEAAINAPTGLNAGGDVAVSRLRLSDRRMVKRMHEGAEAKQKLYSCLVWAGRALTAAELEEKLERVAELQVAQKTPIRVLHRRALMARPKVVHGMRCDELRLEEQEQEQPKGGGQGPQTVSYFRLHLRTSAGTYVKEFVHGDLGRTRPNVGELLGCAADILELDVTDVLLADPEE